MSAFSPFAIRPFAIILFRLQRYCFFLRYARRGCILSAEYANFRQIQAVEGDKRDWKIRKNQTACAHPGESGTTKKGAADTIRLKLPRRSQPARMGSRLELGLAGLTARAEPTHRVIGLSRKRKGGLTGGV